MNDDLSVRDLQTRLRTALHAEASRAEISPDAWARVTERLARPRRRGWLRRLARADRPGRQPPSRSLSPTRRPVVVGLASVTAAAAAVVALVTVSTIVLPRHIVGPNPEHRHSASPAASTATSPTPDATFRPTLADAAAGHDLRVRLELRYGRAYEDGATVLLRPYRWRGGGWTPLRSAPAIVGRAGGWKVAATRSPGVCELRVVMGSALHPESTVRVRLASAGSQVCSKPYEFVVVGERMEPR